MNYKDINDYELLYYIEENDENAYNTLFKKYIPIVKKIGYIFYKNNKNKKIEFEDLCQEGYIALSRAIKEYDNKSALFYTYVSICIKREMEKYVKSIDRQKNKFLNEAISLNKPIVNEEDLYLEDVISSRFDLEEYVQSEENFKILYNLKYELELDKSYVYELKINKFTNKEISQLLDLPYKKVDNIVRKLKDDLKKYMKKNKM